MGAVAGVLLWLACDVPIKRAMIGGVILLLYKVGFALVVLFLLA